MTSFIGCVKFRAQGEETKARAGDAARGTPAARGEGCARDLCHRAAELDVQPQQRDRALQRKDEQFFARAARPCLATGRRFAAMERTERGADTDGRLRDVALRAACRGPPGRGRLYFGCDALQLESPPPRGSIRRVDKRQRERDSRTGKRVGQLGERWWVAGRGEGGRWNWRRAMRCRGGGGTGGAR